MKILLKFHAGKIIVVRINTFANVRMLTLCELEDIPFSGWFKKNAIRSSIDIIIPFRVKFGPLKKRSKSSSFSYLFLILTLHIYSNSVNISEYRVFRNKIFRLKKVKSLLRLHTGKIPVIKINTFANVRMFTLCELKDNTFWWVT